MNQWVNEWIHELINLGPAQGTFVCPTAKHDMMALYKWPPETCKRLSVGTSVTYYTYWSTTHVKYTLSCTWPGKIAARGLWRGAAPWGSRSPRVAEDLRRSSHSLHYLHKVARQDNSRSGRDEYLRTSDGGLRGPTRSQFTWRFHVTGPHEIHQSAVSPHTVLKSTICRIRLSTFFF